MVKALGVIHGCNEYWRYVARKNSENKIMFGSLENTQSYLSRKSANTIGKWRLKKNDQNYNTKYSFFFSYWAETRDIGTKYRSDVYGHR
jgi:hypothetical protein